MEKLQQALEKARLQRGTATMRTDATAPLDPETDDITTAWAALTPWTPDKKRLEKNRIVTTEAGAAATPFDILRTKTLMTMQRNNWQRLAVTSPTEGSGKTTTACNLALAIGRQGDLRTVLFEMDLRRPSIRDRLKLDSDTSIVDVFNGDVSFADHAMRFGNNVAIASAQQSQRDPTSILLRDQTLKIISEIEARYAPHVMIFDLPPLLVSDDARAFLAHVDCALMIGKAEATTVSQIETGEREIAEQTNVLGVVLNQCRHATDVYSNYTE